MKYHIYLDCTLESVPFYVGKGDDARVKNLVRNKKHSAVSKKHGIVRQILASTDNEEAALALERAMIAEFDTFIDTSKNKLACNFTTGGEGASPCAATRKRISAAMKGEKNPTKRPAVRERMSAAHKGKTFSVETRARISAARKGKTFSAEWRAKIGEAKKGDKNPMFGKTLSQEHREKLSASLKGRTLSAATRERMSASLKGRTFSQEHREKLAEANKRRWEEKREKKREENK